MPKSSDQILCQEVFRGFAEEYAGFSARSLLLNAWNRGCYPCQKSGTRGKDALKRMIGSARIFQASRLVFSANVCRANVSGFWVGVYPNPLVDTVHVALASDTGYSGAPERQWEDISAGVLRGERRPANGSFGFREGAHYLR